MYKQIKLKPGYRALVDIDYVDFRLEDNREICIYKVMTNSQLHDFINKLNDLEDKGDIEVCWCKITIKTCNGRVSKIIWLEREVNY